MLNSDIVQLSRRRFAAMLGGTLGAARLRALAPGPSSMSCWWRNSSAPDYLKPVRRVIRSRRLPAADGRRRVLAGLPHGLQLLFRSGDRHDRHRSASRGPRHRRRILVRSRRSRKSRRDADSTPADTLADQVALASGSDNRVFRAGMNQVLARSCWCAALPSRGFEHRILTLAGPAPDQTAAPAWVATFRESHVAGPQFKDAKWHAIQSDANAPPLRVLVDDPARPDEFRALYNASPFAQETQFEFLRTMIAEEKLGPGPGVRFRMRRC